MFQLFFSHVSKYFPKFIIFLHMFLCLLFSSFSIFILISYQELDDLHYLLSMFINSALKNLIYQN